MDKKSFVDWFCDSVKKGGGVSSWECFLKGQQSKQAEINELRKRIDEAWLWCEKGCVLKAMSVLKGESNDQSRN